MRDLRPGNLLTQQPDNDEALVERALLEDDYQAFEVLVCRYSEQFLRLALGLVKDEDEAHDVVQTAFMNMYSKLDTFRLGSNFRSWAYRVVTNTGLMRLRKRKTRQEVELDRVHPASLSDGEPMDLSVTPSWRVRADHELARKELRRVLHEAIEALPPKYHVVFVLKEFEEMSLKQIGAHLELSVPAVKSRLHRARLHLRATLTPYVEA